jgi:alkylated DNA repair dioxygenase AlkB
MSRPDASPDAWRPLALEGADVALLPALPLPQPAPALLQALVDEVPWRQEHLRLFGRDVAQPRLTAWFGDPGATYRYSGLMLTPAPWTSRLADLRDRVAAATGASFDSCLLNLYRDGRDSIGPHADDEPELGERPVIAALSLGAMRDLVFRPKRGRPAAAPVRLALPDSSLLVMRGDTQANWTHGIARTTRPTGPRVSLTFRRILAPRSARAAGG